MFPLKNQYDFDNGVGDIAGLSRAMYQGPHIKEVEKIKKIDHESMPWDIFDEHPASTRETDLSGLSYNENEAAKARRVLGSGRNV